MRRHCFTILSAISLVLCVATCALWVRSFKVSQYVGWASARQFCGVLSMAGLLRFEHATYGAGDAGWSYIVYPTPPGNPPGLWSEVRARDRRGGRLLALGFAYATIDYTRDGVRMRRAVYLPHWAVAILLLLLPARWFWKARRSHPAGAYPACGYDLRATRYRCPECGRVPGED